MLNVSRKPITEKSAAMMAYVECIEACADVLLKCDDEDVLRDVEMRLATLCGLMGAERMARLDDYPANDFGDALTRDAGSF